MGISMIFTLLLFFFFFAQGRKNMHYKAVVFQQISRNKRVWLLVIYNKKGQKMRKSEKTSVFGFAADQNKRVFSIWLLAARFLALFPSRSASWTAPNFSFFTGPELWMTSSSFPSHKKKILPPQALKIPLGFGTQPPCQQLLTRAVAGPGASQNQEEKEAVWWSQLTRGSPWNVQFIESTKIFPFSAPRFQLSPDHTLSFLFFLWGRGEGMDVVF